MAVNSIWADIVELRARFSLSSAHWELSPTLSTSSTSSSLSLSADVSDAFTHFQPHSRGQSWASIDSSFSDDESHLESPPASLAPEMRSNLKWQQMRERSVSAQQQMQHDGLGLENLGLDELQAPSGADSQMMYDASLAHLASLA